MSLPSGILEDKYEALRKIKEGGMGEIYKVRHRLLDEIRVVKLIRSQHAEDDEVRQRFLNEARTAIRLRHPGIAQIYDLTVADDSTAVIVMEFIDGLSLQELLERGGPPEIGLVVEIAEQSLAALAFLHRQGYVHRDISPDNLMLTRGFDGRPVAKLIDLGIAKRLGGSTIKTATGMFLGKARYAAPEQFGQGEVGPHSDIYSYGVLLYELLTGRRPIEGEELSQLIAGHLFRPPLAFSTTDPEGRVPKGLRQVVLRTLAKDPQDRFGSADELAERLVPFRQPYRSPFAGLGRSERPFDPDAATALAPSSPTPVGLFPGPTLAEATKTVPATLPSARARASRARPTLLATLSTAALRHRRLLAAGSGLVVLVSLILLGLRWFGPPEVAAYRAARREIEGESWNLAAQHLRRAVAAEPRERAVAIEVADGVEEPYLPHYFLGLALYRMNNYVAALDEWRLSEDQGVVRNTRRWNELETHRAAIRKLLREEIDAAAQEIVAAGDYADLMKGMQTHPDLEPLWQQMPSLSGRVEAALETFDQTRRRVERLQAGDLATLDSAAASEVLAARKAATAIKDALIELSTEVLDRGESF